jgi:hypothetical protein
MYEDRFVLEQQESATFSFGEQRIQISGPCRLWMNALTRVGEELYPISGAGRSAGEVQRVINWFRTGDRTTRSPFIRLRGQRRSLFLLVRKLLEGPCDDKYASDKERLPVERYEDDESDAQSCDSDPDGYLAGAG